MANKENSDTHHPEKEHPQASLSNENSLQLIVSALSKLPKSKSEKLLERLHVIFAGCMVVVTLSLAIIAYKQWGAATEQAAAAKKQAEAANEQVKVAKGQVELMQSMNTDTKALTQETIKYAKEQAEAARKSVEASKVSAEAAKQAVIISERAIKKTEEMFSLENRPYLLISSSPFDDQSYYKLRPNQRDKILEVHFAYEIKNIGELAATNVVFFTEMSLTDKISGTTTITPLKKTDALINPFTTAQSELTIAPGETHYIFLIKPIPAPNTRPERLVEALKIMAQEYDAMAEESGLGVKITVEYKNEIDKTTAITVSKTYLVFKKRAYTLGSTEPKPIKINPASIAK